MVARRKRPFPATLSSSSGGDSARTLEDALERNTAVQGKRSSESTMNSRPAAQRQRPAATLLRRKTKSR